MGEEKTNLYWRQMLWTNNNRNKQKRNKYSFIWKDLDRWSLSFIGGWGGINYVVLIQYAVTPTRGLVWLIIFSLLSSSSRKKKPPFPFNLQKRKKKNSRSDIHKVCFHPYLIWVSLSSLFGEFSWRNDANAMLIYVLLLPLLSDSAHPRWFCFLLLLIRWAWVFIFVIIG